MFIISRYFLKISIQVVRSDSAPHKSDSAPPCQGVNLSFNRSKHYSNYYLNYYLKHYSKQLYLHRVILPFLRVILPPHRSDSAAPLQEWFCPPPCQGVNLSFNKSKHFSNYYSNYYLKHYSKQLYLHRVILPLPQIEMNW